MSRKDEGKRTWISSNLFERELVLGFVEDERGPSNRTPCCVLNIVEPSSLTMLFHVAHTSTPMLISNLNKVSALDGAPLVFVRVERLTVDKGLSFF